MVASIEAKQTRSGEQSKPRRKLPFTMRQAAAFVMCQVAAIFVVEGVLACAGLGEEEIFKFDPQIGFEHMQNKRVTWRSEGFAQSYLNEDGMREPGLTIEKPANTYRVAVLGDSMVESLHVPVEQTFGEIVAKRLSPLDGKSVQWLNFGTSGYSTVQEYLQLKRKVMKYHPDLVILGYDSRDMFENWTAPDQVVTNVRPYAVHLPGKEMIIVDQPVRRWLRSPRGQFMVATTWIRQHSRIAGLMAALDLEFSQHSPWYRFGVDLVSQPKKAYADFQIALASMRDSKPAFDIKFFEDAPKAAHVEHAVNVSPATAAAGAAAQPSVVTASATTPPPSLYKQLVSRMLSSLFTAMRKECEDNGAQFAVISLPVRAQLCPLPGMETSFAGLNYSDEVQLVSNVCSTCKIPFFDVQRAAENLPVTEREQMYYAVHLTPKGQQFIADSVQPFVRDLALKNGGDPSDHDKEMLAVSKNKRTN